MDWKDTLEPGGTRLFDTPDQAVRRSFVGGDLATTIAVRNGYTGIKPDGELYSLCGGCGIKTHSPMWGKDCYDCRDPEAAAQRRDDRNAELWGSATRRTVL